MPLDFCVPVVLSGMSTIQSCQNCKMKVWHKSLNLIICGLKMILLDLFVSVGLSLVVTAVTLKLTCNS